MNNKQNNYSIIREISFTLLAEGKSIKIRADGFSMYPAIKPGSLIYIEPSGSRFLPVPGEIIAWKRKSGFVVHRLIRIIIKENQTFYITRGDACVREDQPIASGDVAGRVVRVVEHKGEIVKEKKILYSKPNYKFNRLRVLGIHILNKIR